MNKGVYFLHRPAPPPRKKSNTFRKLWQLGTFEFLDTQMIFFLELNNQLWLLNVHPSIPNVQNFTYDLFSGQASVSHGKETIHHWFVNNHFILVCKKTIIYPLVISHSYLNMAHL